MIKTKPDIVTSFNNEADRIIRERMAVDPRHMSAKSIACRQSFVNGLNVSKTILKKASLEVE